MVVLEARDRVGGRVLNHAIGDGKVVEVGGQWIGPTQDRLAALAGDLGVATFPTHGEGFNVLEYAGRLRRYRGAIPRINPVVLLDVERAQRKLNRLARRVPLEAPWEAPRAAQLDGQTVATWMRQNLATKAGRMLLELGIESVWAAQPEDLSLLHALFYIHSAGSLALLFDTEGGAQQDRFVGGSQHVPLGLAGDLGDELVRLSVPVRRIEHGDARGHGPRRRSRGPRPPRDRGGGADAGGPDRLRPAAARLPRPAHPAHADGHGGQVHGRSTTSPSGATRGSRGRARATSARSS